MAQGNYPNLFNFGDYLGKQIGWYEPTKVVDRQVQKLVNTGKKVLEKQLRYGAKRIKNSVRKVLRKKARSRKSRRRYKRKRMPRKYGKRKRRYRRTKRRYRKRRRRTGTSLSKRVWMLEKRQNASQGTHIHRRRRYTNFTSDDGEIKVGHKDINTRGTLDAVLAKLQYYNPADPANLVTADGATGTFSRDYMFAPVRVSVIVRNRGRTPCVFGAYLCMCKDDTSTTVTAAYTAGFDNVVETTLGVPNNETPLFYNNDSDVLKSLYKITRTKKFKLEPGQGRNFVFYTRGFNYNPAILDTQADDYQPDFAGSSIMYRVQGVPGNDSTLGTAELGLVPGSITVCTTLEWKVRYEAGVNLKRITVDDTGETNFTNAGVVSGLANAFHDLT